MNRESKHNPGVHNFDTAYARRARLTTEVLLQGKWRIEILCAMRQGPVRLGQLARLIPAASKKMLTQNLRKLEADGIVIRSDLSDTTLHVEYDLNDSAREAVCALLDELAKWAPSL
jgi:DNA-binding HxlR family transcriptional regulator